jgi:hypothetical protein
MSESAQIARAREGDEPDRGIAELGEAVAHGDRVFMAGQSSQVTVEDHYHRPTPVLRQPPPVTRIIW